MNPTCRSGRFRPWTTPATAAFRLGTVTILLALLVPVGPTSGEEPTSGAGLKTRLRQPVALAFGHDGNRLLVANRRSGSLSVVDPSALQVVAEFDVGRGLTDLAPLPDRRHWLVVDQPANTLLLVEDRGDSIVEVDRLEIGPDPVRLSVAADGLACVVASRWSRRLSVVELGPRSEHPALKLRRTIELPFSPRLMVRLDDGRRLLVADAFGGKLAVVDLERGAIASVRSLPAHNIRGLTVSPDGRSLLVAHQVLNPLAMSRFEDIHWGSMLSNHLRVLRMDNVLASGTDADLLRGSRLLRLGDVGHAAGDPSEVVYDRLGNYLVTLAGVGEVAIGAGTGEPLHQIKVGRRPTAIALDWSGTKAFIADSSDDTVAVVAVGAARQVGTIRLGPRPELSPADRGELLFADARISHDGWMSCQSCHADGHTSGSKNDTLGDDSYGAPKQTPSLLGVGSTPPWTWLGGMERLEDQVRKSVETTMQGPRPSVEQVEDLAAYLRTLNPPPASAVPGGDPAAVERGRAVFRSRECATCHAPPSYTTAERVDVGLADEVGNRAFNPPSLRGVGLRQPLLHDGRAKTLADVFATHRHPRNARFTAQEVADLVAFLQTL